MLNQLFSYPFSKEEKEKIKDAFCLAEEHFRKEKKPDIHSLLEVTEILLTELNLSADAVIAILLKDLIPREFPEEMIVKDYGKSVWELISGLQKIDRMDTTKYTSHAENFIKLMLTLFAIRIILDNTIENEKADCWKVYSLVTDIYTPNSRRLRDWISFPKITGYESLHTTVIGPEGKWVEVQIRTRHMDDIAEKSIAAHWKYKSDGKTDDKTDFYATIREMLENPLPSSPEMDISREKRELYRDEIFIFTPKGDLKKLKAGYTVLDFAFEVHTDIGATCTGAIVNGTMVPLKHILTNGDTVKILTSKNQKPNHNWLEFSKDIVTRLTQLLTNEMKVSVRSIRVKTNSDGSYTCEIGILINSTVRLDEVMKKLLKLKEVQSVTRAGKA